MYIPQIPNEMEIIDILKFKPDRLGHCTCIHPDLQGSKQLFNMLLESKIPVGKRSIETLIILGSKIDILLNIHIIASFLV